MTPRAADTGERLLVELPFPAVLPRLASSELELRNLAARAGAGEAELTVTLLDAPDHRLIRSGVLLAHRVADGAGDWYLSLPGWVRGKRTAPADEQITPLDGEGELTLAFRTAVQPFLRHGTLGPVAALTVESIDYALRDLSGATLGVLRDEKVTIRRAGLTTARYREVTLTTPPGAPLAPERRAWLVESLALVGATEVTEFPSLVRRVGAPATGPSDFPDPSDIDPGTTAGLVTQVVAAGLRDLVRSLAAEPGSGEAPDPSATLADRLGALGPALDPEWTGDVVNALRGWSADGALPVPEAAAETTERRLVVLDRLVAAVRTPPLVAGVESDPRRLLSRLQADAVEEVRERCGRAHIHGDDGAWDGAATAVTDATAVVRLAAEIGVPKSRKRLKRLARLREQLERCRDPYVVEFRARAAADPDTAFELGREYERHRQRIEQARRVVVDDWDDWSARLGR